MGGRQKGCFYNRFRNMYIILVVFENKSQGVKCTISFSKCQTLMVYILKYLNVVTSYKNG